VKAGIVAKGHAEDLDFYLRRAVSFLQGKGVEVLLERDLRGRMGAFEGKYPRRELPFHVDFLVVLGGDGTLLSVAEASARAGIPLLGVNLGFLGFLTEIKKDELEEALEEFLEGRAMVEQRQMLEVEFKGASHLVLNDAVINKSALARMISVRVCVDGTEISKIRADGIIVSTPTGSTGYNLSAGGPIINPQVSAIILTPICPHALTQRPIVIPSSSRVRLSLVSGEEVYLTLDGQRGGAMDEGDRVSIGEAREKLLLVRPSGRSYYQMLREKLGWGS